jgi:predicted DsbA family dithiol-disulfide isomerase
MMTVQVRFYTDPICPWSWAAERALRDAALAAGAPQVNEGELKPVRALTGTLWEVA